MRTDVSGPAWLPVVPVGPPAPPTGPPLVGPLWALLAPLEVVAVVLGAVASRGAVGAAPGLGALAASAVVAALVAELLGLHRPRRDLALAADVPALALVAVAAGVVAAWADPRSATSPGLVLGVFIPLVLAASVLLRAAALQGARLLRRSGRRLEPVVVVGAGRAGRRAAAELAERPELGLVPVGMVQGREPTMLRGLPLPLLGGLADLPAVLAEHGARSLVLTGPDPVALPAEALPRWRAEHVRDLVVLTRPARLVNGSRRLDGLLRRAGDLIGSLVGLAVASPLLLVLGLAVRLETGSAPLVRRPVPGHPTARVWAFRTVRPSPARRLEPAPGGTGWVWPSAEHHGPVGRLLQRTGLDDLPVLLSVLRGEATLLDGVRTRPSRGESAPVPSVSALDGPRPAAGRHARARERHAPRRG